MAMTTRSLILLAAAGALCAPARAQTAVQSVDPSGGVSAAASALQASLSGAGDEEQLFAVEEREGKRFLRLRQGQLERDYLLSATLAKGTGEAGLFSGMMDQTFLFSFHWAGDKLQVLRRDPSRRAEPGSPEARALERSFAPSIIATLPVASSDAAKGTFTFPAEPLFLADLLDVQSRLKRAYPAPDLRPSPPESTLERLKSFPRNTEASVQLVFARSERAGSSMPDSRRIAVTIHYSLSLLPEAGFEPRPYDQRVGFFQTGYQDFSRPDLKDRLAPSVALANRWRLEKKEPEAPVSEPREPIVFWLEETVPERYRPAIKAGILAWNAAFEAAGFRDAIVVKEVDKDLAPAQRAVFDPADASYNMVRWFMGEQAGFAIGPSRVDPTTGEIFNATVSISDAMSRFLGDQSALAAVRPRPAGAGDEEYMDASLREAQAGLAMLEARGSLGPGELERYKAQYLAHVTMHEIGHNLGLRHNFRGSLLHPLDAAKPGDLLTGSVMDYMPPTIAEAGKPQGDYFQTRPGPYDFWAVEWAYKPLSGTPEARSSALEAVAARSASDPALAYGTDEDAGSDPDVQRFDQGRGAVAYARSRTRLARDLWASLEADRASRPDDLRRRFITGYGAYFNGVNAALPVLGGVRVSRQPGGESYAPVPAAEQREALRFLEEAVFGARPVAASPALLRRMGRDRGAAPYQPDAPLSPEAMGRVLQDSVLDSLFGRDLLGRLAERRALVSEPGDAFTARELLATTRAGIWREVGGPKAVSISPERRDLQRRHLARLAALLLDGEAEGDARAAARGELARLSEDVGRALRSRALDADTRLHLLEVADQLRRALDRKPEA